MRYLLLLLFAFPLWADDKGICWDDQPCAKKVPLVPVVIPQVRYPVRAQAPKIIMTPDAEPAIILTTPNRGMTHVVQGSKITTCITVGANMVVCQ